MHCHLKPSVAPDVLGFNYEAHNATADKFNNSANCADPWCPHGTYQISAKPVNPPLSY